MRFLLKWSALGVLTLLLGSIVAFAISFPSIAATACPGCYGLERVGDRIYVGDEMAGSERARVLREIAAAGVKVAAALEPSDARPFILVCSTVACDRRVGGHGDVGARAQVFTTPFASVVRFGPRGMNPTIFAHELAHVTMHEIVGAWAVMDGRFPAWLNEGMAVIVSDDERYLRPGTGAEARCRVEPKASLPADPFEWARAAGRDHHALYGGAACATLRWLEANGGTTALLDALRRTARTGHPVIAPGTGGSGS